MIDSGIRKKPHFAPGLREAAIAAALDHNWPRQRIVDALGCSRRQLQRWIKEGRLEREAALRIRRTDWNEEIAPGIPMPRWGVRQNLPKAPPRRKATDLSYLIPAASDQPAEAPAPPPATPREPSVSPPVEITEPPIFGPGSWASAVHHDWITATEHRAPESEQPPATLSDLSAAASESEPVTLSSLRTAASEPVTLSSLSSGRKSSRRSLAWIAGGIAALALGLTGYQLATLVANHNLSPQAHAITSDTVSGNLGVGSITTGGITATTAANNVDLFGTTTGTISIGDTAGGGSTVQIGGTASGTPSTFRLGVGNSITDPTEVDGAMYFNTTTGNATAGGSQFRCGIAGTWVNCMGLLSASTAPGPAVQTCATACGALASASVPANFCQTGRHIHITARGVFSVSDSSPSLQMGVYWGNSANRASDTLVGALSPWFTLASGPNQAWNLDYDIICYRSNVMDGNGTLEADAGGSLYAWPLTSIAPTTGLITDAKGYGLYVFPIWTKSTANSVTDEQFIVEVQ